MWVLLTMKAFSDDSSLAAVIVIFEYTLWREIEANKSCLLHIFQIQIFFGQYTFFLFLTSSRLMSQSSCCKAGVLLKTPQQSRRPPHTDMCSPTTTQQQQQQRHFAGVQSD